MTQNVIFVANKTRAYSVAKAEPTFQFNVIKSFIPPPHRCTGYNTIPYSIGKIYESTSNVIVG